MCDECEEKAAAAARFTRRGLLAFAAGAAVGVGLGFWSCQEEPKKKPGIQWGTIGAGSATAPGSASATAGAEVITQPAPDLGEEVFCDASGRAIAKVTDAPLIVIPRASWTDVGPNLAQMKVMNGVDKITVHHTAMAMQSDAWNPTAGELEIIREFHTGTKVTDRHWADIAYHFVIDRAGRAWQARPLAYQGAHVKGHNEHNLGIVLLGNFEVQMPAAAQLVSLGLLIGFARKLYRVGLEEVFTHGELGMTSCPGKHLQAYMNRARRKWGLAEGVVWVATTRPAVATTVATTKM